MDDHDRHTRCLEADVKEIKYRWTTMMKGAHEMTITDHYREAEDTLTRAQPSSPGDQQDLITAQLHALFVVVDELRNIRKELMEMRGMLARNT